MIKLLASLNFWDNNRVPTLPKLILNLQLGKLPKRKFPNNNLINYLGPGMVILIFVLSKGLSLSPLIGGMTPFPSQVQQHHNYGDKNQVGQL